MRLCGIFQGKNQLTAAGKLEKLFQWWVNKCQ